MKVPKLLKALLPARRSRKRVFSLEHTRDVLDDVFGEDVHLARVRSLANGVTGVLNATMVSVSAVGRAYAEVAHIGPKSGVKQVDRLLSNDGVDLDEVGAAFLVTFGASTLKARPFAGTYAAAVSAGPGPS